MPLLFSYGTLQKEKTQLALFGRPLQGSNDVLPGWRVAMVEITDKTFLARGEEKQQRILQHTGNATDTIEGTVLELTEEELLAADAYEPANYKRTEVTLRSGKKAWVYVAV